MFNFYSEKKTRKQMVQLDNFQKKQDWPALSKAYYNLGVAAMECKDWNKAMLWLSRASTIYSAKDEVFEAVGSKLIDNCSDRIGRLESMELIYNRFPEEMEEKAQELSDVQLRLWGLLSLARFTKLWKELSTFPGCEVLCKLDWAVDLILKTFQEPVTQDEFDALFNLRSQLYALGDSPAIWDGTNQIDVPSGEPFQLFDLNGMRTHLEVFMYLDDHLQMLIALSNNQQPERPGCSILGCTLLLDYYARTVTCHLEDVPQIQSEQERIQSDYEMIYAGINMAQIASQINKYKKLDILCNR